MQRRTRARVMVYHLNNPRTCAREVVAHVPLELLASVPLELLASVYFRAFTLAGALHELVWNIGYIEPKMATKFSSLWRPLVSFIDTLCAIQTTHAYSTAPRVRVTLVLHQRGDVFPTNSS